MGKQQHGLGAIKMILQIRDRVTTDYAKKIIDDEVTLLTGLSKRARKYEVLFFTREQVKAFISRTKKLKRKWRIDWWYDLRDEVYRVTCKREGEK